jgi:phosphatidylinositol glycan class H protein
MLTTAPHLRTRRPSPTTVEYTVSTAPDLTLSLRALTIFTILLRLSIGLSILFLLYMKFLQSSYSAPLEVYSSTPPILTNDFILYIAYFVTTSYIGTLFASLSSRITALVLVPTSSALLYALSLRLHTTESLLVLRGLGIQTSSSSSTYLSSSTTRFIPTEKIQDIFINEAFRGFEVRYYLVVVVEGEESVVVVFPRLLPRRTIVEKVWRGARGCLFEGVSEKQKEKDGETTGGRG